MEDKGQEIRDYLLGNLDSAEFESMDLVVIADPGFENQLALGESELNEDFIDGLLTENDVSLFFKNYLVTPERKADLHQIRLLRKRSVESASLVTEEAEDDNHPDFFQRLRKMFDVLLRPIPALTLLIVVALSGLVIWQMLADESVVGLSELQNEFVKLNKIDLSVSGELLGKSSINLLPGVWRDGNGQRKINAAEFGGEVILRLAVPAGIQSGANYRVVIRDPAGGLLTTKDVTVFPDTNGDEFRLLLPSGFIVPGTYRIEMTASGKDGELPLVYSFLAE